MRGLLTVLLGCFCLLGLAQQRQSEIEKEEQAARDELRKRREAMMEAYERDPERFMDSMRIVRANEAHQEAVKRIQRYQQNDRIDTLKTIDLSNGRLEDIPNFVFEASSVEKLVLDHNKIDKLPWKIRKLDRLEDIRWSHNTTARKKKVWWNDNIKKIILVDNQLIKTPPFHRIKNLKFLDISQNELKEIPVKQIARMDSLQEVVMKQNPIGFLGRDRYAKMESLEVLKLNKCNIDSIHTDFYQIPNLRELQLQENPLTSLSEGISKLTKLSKISFYKCHLEYLPNDFFDIPNLTIADLYYNELNVISESVENAKNIEVLFLSHNQIYDLPETLGNLKNLEELYLHNNRLSYLPESVANLDQLRVLRINKNLLQHFPIQILSLDNLTDLDVDDNMIEQIPAKISLLNDLQLFTFDGNPINFRDPENKAFMESIAKMQERGTICKPKIQMDFVDDTGKAVELN